MNCCLKNGIHKHSPRSRVHVEVLHFISRSSIERHSYNRMDFVHVGDDFRGYVEIIWPRLSALGSPEFSETLEAAGFPALFLYATGSPVTSPSWTLQDSDSEKSHDTSFSTVATGFPALSSIKPPRYTSFSFTWELGASSGIELLLVLLAGFPAAMSFAGSEDVIIFFADQELAETVKDRFIAVGLDFATILSSSFCSCTLFAIF